MRSTRRFGLSLHNGRQRVPGLRDRWFVTREAALSFLHRQVRGDIAYLVDDDEQSQEVYYYRQGQWRWKYKLI